MVPLPIIESQFQYRSCILTILNGGMVTKLSLNKCLRQLNHRNHHHHHHYLTPPDGYNIFSNQKIYKNILSDIAFRLQKIWESKEKMDTINLGQG